MRILPPEEAKRMIRAKVAQWKRDRLTRLPKPQPLEDDIIRLTHQEAAQALAELRHLLNEADDFEEDGVSMSSWAFHCPYLVPTEKAISAMNRFLKGAQRMMESFEDDPEVLSELYSILEGYISSELYDRMEQSNRRYGIYHELMEGIKQKIG